MYPRRPNPKPLLSLQSRTAEVVFVSCNEAAVGPLQGPLLRAKRDVLGAMLTGSSLLPGQGALNWPGQSHDLPWKFGEGDRSCIH